MRLFPTQFTWLEAMNMIKMVWCRFQQCLGTSVMLLVEGSSETGHFRHLTNQVFGVRKFRNTKAIRVIFFSKCLKFNLNFKNEAKNWKKVFCFSGNWIRTGIVKLFLLRTGYFSSTANVLTSSTSILHVNRRGFFKLSWLASD